MGGSEKLEAILLDVNGKAIVNGTVIFTIMVKTMLNILMRMVVHL